MILRVLVRLVVLVRILVICRGCGTRHWGYSRCRSGRRHLLLSDAEIDIDVNLRQGRGRGRGGRSLTRLRYSSLNRRVVVLMCTILAVLIVVHVVLLVLPLVEMV